MHKIASVLTTLVVLFLVLVPRAANGDVALKPRGENAAPLRMKSLKAEVTLEQGRFATTAMDLTFQNTVHDRIEADFIYTVPDGAVVTDFAYFYGEERVVARIVEKERAAAIYHYITSRMRDPALVEMIGKNRFRARIFPVMPDADLRVQIRYVQALPIDRGIATYTLPIATPRTERLETAQITVHIPDRAQGTVTNNFGLPFATVGARGQQLTIAAENWRTNKNLKISFAPSRSERHQAFFAAPSGGSDGFFALSVSPLAGRKPPALRFAGIATYAIETTTWKGGLLFTGRYRKSGKAIAVLRDGAKPVGSFPVTFSGIPEPKHPAASLWAAAHIERLSRVTGNAKQIIALSTRFNLPSKWTSWLAVPEAERARFHREMAMAELSLIAGNLAHLTIDGRAQSKAAAGLRKRYQEQYRKAGNFQEGELPYFMQMALQNATDQTGQALLKEIIRGKANGARAGQLRSLLRFFGATDRETIRNIEESAYYSLAYETAQEIARQVRAGKAALPGTRRLRQRLAYLCKRVDRSPEGLLTGYFSSELYAMQQTLTEELQANRDHSRKANESRAGLRRLSSVLKTSVEESYRAVVRNRTSQMLQEWAKRVVAGEAGTLDVQAIRDSIYRVAERVDSRGRQWANEVIQETASEFVRGYAYSLVHGSHGEAVQLDSGTFGIPSPGQLERIRTKIQYLSQAAGLDPQPFLDEVEAPYRVAEAERVRDRIVAERAQKMPNTSAIQSLETQYRELMRGNWWQNPYYYPSHWFYRSNTPDGREAWAKDRLARIAARAEGEAIDVLLAGVPDPADVARLTAERAQLKRKEEEIHARMGDPLLQAAADESAQSVTAQMPDGEIKPLIWNPVSRRWEARFDIPTYAKEGDFVILLVTVAADGTRTTDTLTYHVDVTPPIGKAMAVRLSEGRWRLTVETEADVARIAAKLTGREMYSLLPQQPEKDGLWSVVITGEEGDTVTVILTDRAHNRTELAVRLEDTAAKEAAP